MAAKLTSNKAKPQTMADLLASYEAAKVRSFSAGQKVKAKVVAITPKLVILDIGAKSEGIVAEKAFAEARDYISTLKVGDEVVAAVLIPESREGEVILSLRDAVYQTSWGKLQEAREKDEEIAVLGKGVTNSGINVEAEGISGFIPLSQLSKEAAKNPQNLIGKYFKAKVIEVNKSFNKVVLSEKEVSEAADIKAAKKALLKIKEGDIFEGEVTTVANFGCFVKIRAKVGKKDLPLEGLVHLSELSWGKVPSVSQTVGKGDKVRVKVISARGGKLALSIKQALKDPWDDVEKKYKVESKLKGKVVKLSDFGVFVELEPGVEGLIHITKIPPAIRFAEGQEVNIIVEEVNPKERRLSLSPVLTSKPIGYK